MRHRLLLVEDGAHARERTRTFVERRGVHVDGAGWIVQARCLLSSARYEAVVTDLQASAAEGSEGLAVVVATGHHRPGTAHRPARSRGLRPRSHGRATSGRRRRDAKAADAARPRGRHSRPAAVMTAPRAAVPPSSLPLETADDLAAVVGVGIDLGQGFFLAPPLGVEVRTARHASLAELAGEPSLDPPPSRRTAGITQVRR